MSDVLEDVKEDTTTITEDGEHDLFSHYVRKEDILKAQIDGIPAVALCGKEWVPTRDEEKYPVCGTCKDIYESLTQ
jgi:predicted hydrolase (HD superfamily)